MATKSLDKKRLIGLILSVIIMLLASFIGLPAGVTRAGLYAIAIFFVAIFMWICDTLPMGVTALLTIFMLAIFGVVPQANVYSSFGGTAFFFAIATFVVSIALENTTIPLRICYALTKLTKGDSKKLVIALLLATGLVSSVMSNLSSCIIFMNLGLALLKANNCEPGKSGLGKCLMIGIPACAGCGGLITPAGTPGNTLIIQLLSENAGINITFLQWVALFAPLAIFSIIMFGVWETIIFKPEAIKPEALEELNSQLKQNGPLKASEKKTLAVIILMLVFWVLGTWVPAFDVTLVAICGMALMFMPGMDALTWDDAKTRVNWNLCLTMGAVSVLVTGLNTTGVMNWVVTSIFSGITSWNIFAMFLVIGTVVCLIRAFIPTAPAIAALFGAPLLSLAPLTGASAVALLYIPAFWACTPTLLWIEPIFLFTYGYGYYKPQDVLKYGSVPTVILLAVMSFLPKYVELLGF